MVAVGRHEESSSAAARSNSSTLAWKTWTRRHGAGQIWLASRHHPAGRATTWPPPTRAGLGGRTTSGPGCPRTGSPCCPASPPPARLPAVPAERASRAATHPPFRNFLRDEEYSACALSRRSSARGSPTPVGAGRARGLWLDERVAASGQSFASTAAPSAVGARCPTCTQPTLAPSSPLRDYENWCACTDGPVQPQTGFHNVWDPLVVVRHRFFAWKRKSRRTMVTGEGPA
eukprot:COSAG04_NODE_1078_length_8422_cov_5.090833_2_plen_231_part_00